MAGVAIAYQSAKRIEVRNRSNGQLLTMTEAPNDVAASYRWNGDFVRELTLSRPILGFAVSSAGDRLWGFLVEGLPYAGIGEWVLPPLSG